MIGIALQLARRQQRHHFCPWLLSQAGCLETTIVSFCMSQMILVIEQPQIMSLIGHVIYGVITALLFVPLSKRL